MQTSSEPVNKQQLTTNPVLDQDTETGQENKKNKGNLRV